MPSLANCFANGNGRFGTRRSCSAAKLEAADRTGVAEGATCSTHATACTGCCGEEGAVLATAAAVPAARKASTSRIAASLAVAEMDASLYCCCLLPDRRGPAALAACCSTPIRHIDASLRYPLVRRQRQVL
jgi:hypothetical protein